MCCLDCFYFLFGKKKYEELHELEEIVIVKNNNKIDTKKIRMEDEEPLIKMSELNEIKPVKINITFSDDDDPEEVLYQKQEEIYSFDEVSDSEFIKGNQKLKKRKIKKEIEYSSDDSWDNSLIL